MAVLKAHAKINLWLRVLAREVGTGYHQIETAFCRLELADDLVVESNSDGFELAVHGADLGDPHLNLVSRAVQAFARATGSEPALRIRLNKNIPAGAGLGGGSSDAAATLRALNGIHGHPLDALALHELACGLGADVPFFLSGAVLAIGWGRGDRLLALPPPPPATVIIIWPGTPIPTADAYAALTVTGRTARAPAAVLHRELRDWDAIAELAANDFEAVAPRWIPEFDAMRRALLDAGAGFALLAGSGSAVFGLFDSPPATGAADALQARFPGMSVMETRTAGDLLPGVDPPSTDG